MRAGFPVRLATAMIAVGVSFGQSQPDFSRTIEPLLRSRCYSCHGERVQMRHLRLDRRSDALRGGESGVPAIIPGNSAQSLLIRYVSGGDVVMPPTGPRLTAEQIDLLKVWIDAGAIWPGAETEQQVSVPKSQHWSFQPIIKPKVPIIQSNWIRNPIDAFVLAKLQSRGWKPAPAAESRALMRRIYLDLTGLPPTLEEQKNFLAHPEAVDDLVSELLSRPSYGERWARHWLDLVRYAETNGYERDATKPNAWRYRDYVINAFNQDKPFNRFVLEQLAGDELPDASPETFTALGYNRLGPWDDEPADPATDRFDQLDDVVSTTSQVFLGMTIGCARCHNHKFEPLTARDYYSMVAVFDGLQRPRNGRTELDRPAGTWAQINAIDERDRKIQECEKRIEQIRSSVRDDLLKSGASSLPEDAAAAFREEPSKRSDKQKTLVTKYKNDLEEQVSLSMPAKLKDQVAAERNRIEELRAATPDILRAYYLQELSPKITPTFLLIRGKAEQPGPEVSANVPAVLAKHPLALPAPGRTSFRRITFANWLVNPENPLTARVIVNRIWQHHFGEGLVRTPSDFGVMGEKPTHPELLDWLAAWFVENGWSIKRLHRLIMSSSAYRMSKQWNAEHAKEDPEDRLLWRMPYQRLEVEAIRDSALLVSGQLNTKMFGPSVYPHIPPAALEGNSDPDKIWKESDEQTASRRTVYVFLKRSMIVPMLEVLDLCDTSHTAAKRQNTSVATQALTLFNGDFVNRQAHHFAERLRREAGEDRQKQIDLAYRLALARPPTSDEARKIVDFLKQNSLEQLCRVIFNLNEFAYVD